VLRPDQEPAAGKTTELLQIDDRVVLTPAGGDEDIAAPERRRDWLIDAAGDAESELRHPAAEGDPRFLRREPAVKEVAGHRLAAEWIGASSGRAFLCGGRVVGEEIDRAWRGEPFGDRLAVSGFLGSAAQGPGREEQADQDRQAGGGGTGGFQ
jgi:hypothetical protein